MTSPLSRSVLFALAAAGLASAPMAFAQQPAPSDQAVENQTVHSNAPDRHLAPRDTFYTMSYDSKRTDKGVEGFPPGTEVHLVSVNREAHTLTVTDGHANIELSPDKLTNDIDIAAMVRAQDTASQEQIARYQQAELANYQKYQKEVADYTAKDLEKREQAIQKSNEQLQEQAATSHADQPSDTSANYNNGYYNQGGSGYGNPYSYFVDLGGYNQQILNQGRTQQASTVTPTGSNGKGAVSSTQNGNQSGNSRTGAATSGTTSSSTGGGTGGKAGGKP